jgi:hypothetical protein
VNLAIEGALVRDIHRDVHRIGAVCAGRRKRHRQGIAELECDLVFETEQARKVAGNFAELWREVDARDPPAEPLREVARRSADAAAEVQDMA